MLCPRCNVEMKKGIAIHSNIPYGCLTIVTAAYIVYKNLKIIDCLKCPKCGHSDDRIEYKMEVSW